MSESDSAHFLRDRIHELGREVATLHGELNEAQARAANAYDRAERAEERVRVLEGALQPLAEYVKTMTAGFSPTDWDSIEESIAVPDMLKRARAALAPAPEPECSCVLDGFPGTGKHWTDCPARGKP